VVVAQQQAGEALDFIAPPARARKVRVDVSQGGDAVVGEGDVVVRQVLLGAGLEETSAWFFLVE
jgi:hypothetical protein